MSLSPPLRTSMTNGDGECNGYRAQIFAISRSSGDSIRRTGHGLSRQPIPLPIIGKMDASPQLLEHVAAATGHRDRDEIELSLVRLLQQFLQADSVTLFKLVREAGTSRAVHCIGALTDPDGMVGITRGGPNVHLLERDAWRRCAETRE